ncbi:MAG: VacJ family lipoprotein [Deltaproteobacteria bacterium]|nr:MAG: VacJ family lipoprotein [Deltaproteobacteria bacterium]
MMRRLTILVLTTVFAAGMASRATGADDDLQRPIADAELDLSDDYDPWQGFNEKMFFFNHDILDHYVLKPVATGWGKVLPDVGKRGLDRAFDNLGMPKRLVNNLLQGRFRGAGRELARFGVNTTVGVVGFLDVARAQLHIEKSDADTGQTLGLYGFGQGPYLVLPTLRPLTVRDGIGYGVDGVLDPFGYVTPFFARAGEDSAPSSGWPPRGRSSPYCLASSSPSRRSPTRSATSASSPPDATSSRRTGRTFSATRRSRATFRASISSSSRSRATTSNDRRRTHTASRRNSARRGRSGT